MIMMILDNGAVMMMKFVIWLCEIIVEFHWAISDVCDFNDLHWKSRVFTQSALHFQFPAYICVLMRADCKAG